MVLPRMPDTCTRMLQGCVHAFSFGVCPCFSLIFPVFFQTNATFYSWASCGRQIVILFLLLLYTFVLFRFFGQFIVQGFGERVCSSYVKYRSRSLNTVGYRSDYVRIRFRLRSDCVQITCDLCKYNGQIT